VKNLQEFILKIVIQDIFQVIIWKKHKLLCNNNNNNNDLYYKEGEVNEENIKQIED
jgi:hypothetical protein